MAKIYVNLILQGLKTIEDVPARLRQAVEELLKEVEPNGLESTGI